MRALDGGPVAGGFCRGWFSVFAGRLGGFNQSEARAMFRGQAAGFDLPIFISPPSLASGSPAPAASRSLSPLRLAPNGQVNPEAADSWELSAQRAGFARKGEPPSTQVLNKGSRQILW